MGNQTFDMVFIAYGDNIFFRHNDRLEKFDPSKLSNLKYPLTLRLVGFNKNLDNFLSNLLLNEINYNLVSAGDIYCDYYLCKKQNKILVKNK